MIYIPKISPIFFRQLVDKPNVSQDLGQQFEAIDYLNFKKYFPLNEVVRFQFMSDSANPDVQITGNCEDYYLYENVLTEQFDSWTGDDPDGWTVQHEDANNEITEGADNNSADFIVTAASADRLRMIKVGILTVGNTYNIKAKLNSLVSNGNGVRILVIPESDSANYYELSEGVNEFRLTPNSTADLYVISNNNIGSVTAAFDYIIVDKLVSDIDITNITPAGWAGDGSYVYEATFTPPTEGNANIYIFEDGELFESEILQFENIDNYIKIGFKNSENDYGYVGSNRLISYYNGDLNEALPGNDIVSYQNDRGELTKLRSTPLEIYKLNIYEVPYYVANQLNLIFSCDDIEINEQTFENEENPNASLIETSNLFNIDIDLTRTNDNYKTETTTDSNYDFDALDSGGIESNNSLIIDSTI